MGRAVCALFPPPRLHVGRLGREPDLSFALSPLQPRRLSSESRRPTHTCRPAQNGAERSQAPEEGREARRAPGLPGFPALTPPRGPPSLRAPPGAECAGPPGRRAPVFRARRGGAGRRPGPGLPRPLPGGGFWGRPGTGPARRSVGAPEPRAPRLAAPQAGARPAGRWCSPPRARASALPSSGSEAPKGAERRGRRAAGGPCPRFRPPARPRLAGLPPRRCAAPRPSSSRSGRPSRARERRAAGPGRGAGRDCRGRGADAEARPWRGRPAPGSRWSRGRAAAGLPPAAPAASAAARGCCSPASGCCCWPGQPRAPQVSTAETPGPRPCLFLLLLFSKSCFPRPPSFILHCSLALLS